MIPMKKELRMEHNDEMIEKLLRSKTKVPTTVSLKKFIDINFQAFVNSGKTTREIYEFLIEEKYDVSSFQVFKTLFSKVKKSKSRVSVVPVKSPNSEELSTRPKESTLVVPSKEPEILQNGGESDVRKEPRFQAKVSKYNPMLPPIMLPGGVEAFINPETGGKSFEIESGKE